MIYIEIVVPLLFLVGMIIWHNSRINNLPADDVVINNSQTIEVMYSDGLKAVYKCTDWDFYAGEGLYLWDENDNCTLFIIHVLVKEVRTL